MAIVKVLASSLPLYFAETQFKVIGKQELEKQPAWVQPGTVEEERGVAGGRWAVG